MGASPSPNIAYPSRFPVYVRRLAPKVLNAKTSALRPRITPYPEGYLDNARISEPELHPKYINLGVGPP